MVIKLDKCLIKGKNLYQIESIQNQMIVIQLYNEEIFEEIINML